MTAGDLALRTNHRGRQERRGVTLEFTELRPATRNLKTGPVSQLRWNVLLGRILASPTETGDAHAIWIFVLFVDQTVNDATVGIELRCDYVEVLSVLCVVATEDCICDMIGKLNDTRSLRIDKEWRVGKIANYTPLRAKGSEFAGHTLQGCFVGTFVQDEKPSLTIAVATQSIEVTIEAAAQVLERQFHQVGVGERCLVNGTGKCTGRVVGITKGSQHRFDDALRFFLRHAAPRCGSAGEDFRCVKLDTVRVARLNAFRKVVELLGDPMSLGFINGDAAQDEVILVGVSRRPGIVEVEEMHGAKKGQPGGQSPADRVGSPPNRTRIIGWKTGEVKPNWQIDWMFRLQVRKDSAIDGHNCADSRSVEA